MCATRTAALVLTCVLISACGQGHHEGHSPAGSFDSHESTVETHELQLNGTKKWQMDDHTRSMLATMVTRIAQWSPDGKAAAGLGEALGEDLDSLIRDCTMTGAAHDELHKLLTGLIPAIDKLAATGSEGELQTVKRLLASYPMYFE